MSNINEIKKRFIDRAEHIVNKVLGDSMYISEQPNYNGDMEKNIINMINLTDEMIAEMHAYFSAFEEYTCMKQAKSKIMYDLVKNQLDLKSKKDEDYIDFSNLTIDLKSELTIIKGLNKKYDRLAKATHYELVSRANNAQRGL